MDNDVCITPFFLDRSLPGLASLAEPGWTINQPKRPASDRLARMSMLHQALADRVEAAVAAGQRPVSIAGDCCTAIGVLAGLQRAGINPTLIWFDAHGDFNTPETTPSGFLGGMPLAMMVGRGDATLPKAVGLAPLPENQVILTDARDLDPGEAAALAQSAVTVLTEPADLLARDLPDGPLYVHFDVDVVALEESPAQNYPAAGGPTAAGLHAVFGRLAETGRVVAVSVSTWNPDLDPDRTSETVSMDLLQTLVA
jgi:arginase